VGPTWYHGVAIRQNYLFVQTFFPYDLLFSHNVCVTNNIQTNDRQQIQSYAKGLTLSTIIQKFLTTAHFQNVIVITDIKLY